MVLVHFMQACAIPSVWLERDSNMECIIPKSQKNICLAKKKLTPISYLLFDSIFFSLLKDYSFV